MSRRKKEQDRASVLVLPRMLGARIRSPLAIALGTPTEAADLVAVLGLPEMTCYQMDLHVVEQLQRELDEVGLEAKICAAPDLWDLPAEFQTVIYLSARGGERHLKIDMIEQASHILRPGGNLLVWSPYEADQAFPAWLKKIFGKVYTHTAEGVTVFRCQSEGEHARRRHEVTFQCRIGEGPSLRFLSRPGVFSYGRFDEGARALVETMEVHPGDNVLDLGCGCGTNGVFAAQRSGPNGFATFVDSNVRAIQLTELNARSNGVGQFEAIASAHVEGMSRMQYDVVLANPPYYAYSSIAKRFVERSRELLRPGGRLYLVTKQPDQVAELVVEHFGEIEGETRRGYTVLCAVASRSRA